MNNKILKVTGLCCLLCCSSLKAMVIRHDVNDSEYINLASHFNSTVTFTMLHNTKDVVQGTGTIIRNNWVLTAAHVANILKVGDDVHVDSKIQTIQKIIIHPKWQDRKFPFDIALVKIEMTPERMVIANLYDKSDEVSQIATFLGRGDFGNGLKGIINSDGLLRAAQNVVEEVDPQWIRFKFDQGDKSLALEGISGPGDSGGPAFISNDKGLFIIGVSSWQDAAPTNWLEARYNVIENYSRVSYFIDWIRENTVDCAQKKECAK
jgi:hypothetical protein